MPKKQQASHPIDAALRARLRKLDPHQTDFAHRIGRQPAWLNKYMQGAGHATVDDVIRIAAVLIGVDAPHLTDADRRLLRLWRQLPVDAQPDALKWLRLLGRARGQSTGRSGRNPQAGNHKGGDTR